MLKSAQCLRVTLLALLAITPTASAQWLIVPQLITNPSSRGIMLLDATDGTPVSAPWIGGLATASSAIQVGSQVWVADGAAIRRYDIDFSTSPPTATPADPISPLPFNALAGAMELFNGRIYVIGGQTGGVLVYDAAGNLLEQFETNNSYFRADTDLVAFRGGLLITDIPDDAIRQFDANHQFIGYFHNSNGTAGIDNPFQLRPVPNTFHIMASGLDFPGGIYTFNGHGDEIARVSTTGVTGFHPLPSGDIILARASTLQRYVSGTGAFEPVPGSAGLFAVGKIEPLNVFVPGCGNGLVEAGEACDDGNTFNADGCTAACQFGPLCGDGLTEPGELCDDGNLIDNDGCDQDCATGEIVAICGNGLVEPGEPCDDGNLLNGDGCDQECVASVCGNGNLEPGEQCDDANADSGDGCDSDCAYEISCGNGRLDIGEQCDDGNTESGDGCDAGCMAENYNPALCIEVETHRLMAPAPQFDDNFAIAAAIEGGRLLIGAAGVNDFTGSAFVFQLIDNTWTMTAELQPSESAEGDNFGDAVALDGDVAVVGAVLGDTESGQNSGAIYVFRRNEDGWIQEARLAPTLDDLAGQSGPIFPSVTEGVAVSGDTILVGGRQFSPGGVTGGLGLAGGAWTFRYVNGQWTPEQKILSPEPRAIGGFGTSVDLQGDVAVISEPGENAVHVFRRNESGWVHEQKLSAPSENDIDFGRSIGLSDDTIVIGAPGWSSNPGFVGTGAAWVYRRIGATWSVEKQLLPGDGLLGRNYGWTVDIDGDRAVVGAELDNEAAPHAGAAYLYQRRGSGWSETAKVFTTNPHPEQRLSRAASMSGDRLLLGSQTYNSTGAAFIYDLAIQDCNENGVADRCDVLEQDCNQNGIPDSCDIASGTSMDCQPDGTPDECQLGNTPQNVLADGGLEAGTPNPFWTEASTNFGTPICSTAVCGSGDGSFFPLSGQFFAWFGGVADPETGSLEQTVVLPVGTAELTFFLRIAIASGNQDDFLRVTLDGNEVFLIPNTEPGFTLQYAPVHVDLSAFADGNAHALRFESTITGTPFGSSFLVDDISLTAHPLASNDSNGNGIPDDCENASCPTIPGDIDGDSVLDARDVSGFVECLLSDQPLTGACHCADFNGDHAADPADIALFVTTLLNQ